jgi:hypothetical protein
MPILRVTKNGAHICTVGSNDVWMFSASVWAELWGPEASTLDVSGGGKRRPDGSSDFLIWEMPHTLAAGDRVCLSFEEGEISRPDGELFDPPAETLEQTEGEISFPPTAEEMEKLESRPHVNAELVWRVSINDAHSFSVVPDSIGRTLGCGYFGMRRDPIACASISPGHRSAKSLNGRAAKNCSSSTFRWEAVLKSASAG